MLVTWRQKFNQNGLALQDWSLQFDTYIAMYEQGIQYKLVWVSPYNEDIPAGNEREIPLNLG